MRGRVPQGVELEDRVFLGLSASRLGWAAGGLALAWALLHSTAPLGLNYIAAAVVAALGAAVAWIRLEELTLDAWSVILLAYWARTRVIPWLEKSRPTPVTKEPDEQHVPAVTYTVRATDDPEHHAETAREATRGPHIVPAGDAPADIAAETKADEDTTGLDAITANDAPPAGQRVVIAFPNGGALDDPDWLATPPPPAHPAFTGAARRITFFALKGGLGRTTLACEVSALLASRARAVDPLTGRPERLRVALVDLDLTSATVGLRLGLTQPTWWDYMAETQPPPATKLAALHRPTGLHVLLGPPRTIRPDAPVRLDAARFAAFLNDLETAGFHFLVVDLRGELSDLNTFVLGWCHDIYLVTASSPSAVHATYRAVEALRRMGMGPKLRFVEQMATGDATELRDVIGDLQGRLCGRIPHDLAFTRAELKHRPIVLDGAQPATLHALNAFARVIYPALAPGVTQPRGRSLIERMSRMRTSA